jgi:ElaB/YqjD/DUF883 family membrane-anchored ribosome-binding protein
MKSSSVSETSRRYRKYASNELQALLSSSEELLESLSDQSGEAVEDLRAKLTTSIERAKQRLAGPAEAVSSGALEAADAAQSYVERNPWKSLAIGTLAGVLVGAVLTSKDGLLSRLR